MSRRNVSARSAQSGKSRTMRDVQRIQELRRSNAAAPVPSGTKYKRTDWRNQKQAGYLDDEGWDD